MIIYLTKFFLFWFCSFKPPKKHTGWGNRTFKAREFRTNCPQLHNYDEVQNNNRNNVRQTGHEEDCLYLNIWTPQVSI